MLIAGTGLTAVDVVVELLHRRHAGPIFAFSRRALLPRSHGAAVTFPGGLQRALPASLRALMFWTDDWHRVSEWYTWSLPG